MNIRYLALILAIIFISAPVVFSQQAVDVGNKICPISGQAVGEMGALVKYEYKGKIYNFCCAGCVATFKEDPEKYVKIVEEQMGQAAQMEPEKMSEGYHHDMGEMEEHMVMTPKASEAMQGAAMMESASPEVKEFDVEAYKFGYSPDRIIVKKGDTVRLHATSKDVPHGVLIKEYGINERVEKGKVTDIEFVADKAGAFDIRCSVYCGAGHRDMKAQLVVE